MTPKLTNVDSGPTSIMQGYAPSSYSELRSSIITIPSGGTIYFGDTLLSHKHVELLDRLLRQEFPEEFI